MATTPQGGGQPLSTTIGATFGRSPARWVSENYYVRTEYVRDIIFRFRVLPTCDAFASHQDFRFPIWWGPLSPFSEDSFSQNWGEGLLWMNPPYSRLNEVLDKVRADAAHVLFVAPRWGARLWYKEAEKLAVAKLVYPPGIHFFQHPEKKNRTSLWPVTAFLLCGHPEKCTHQHFRDLHTFPAPPLSFGPVYHYFPTARSLKKHPTVDPKVEEIQPSQTLQGSARQVHTLPPWKSGANHDFG